MTTALAINRQLVAGVLGTVAEFLETAGCPFTDDQRAVLNDAVSEMGLS